MSDTVGYCKLIGGIRSPKGTTTIELCIMWEVDRRLLSYATKVRRCMLIKNLKHLLGFRTVHFGHDGLPPNKLIETSGRPPLAL